MIHTTHICTTWVQGNAKSRGMYGKTWCGIIRQQSMGRTDGYICKLTSGNLPWDEYLLGLFVAYRNIHQVTCQFYFPISLYNDVVQDIYTGAKYCLVVDMQNSYWKVMEEEGAWEELEFLTPDVSWLWKVIPMGALKTDSIFLVNDDKARTLMGNTRKVCKAEICCIKNNCWWCVAVWTETRADTSIFLNSSGSYLTPPHYNQSKEVQMVSPYVIVCSNGCGIRGDATCTFTKMIHFPSYWDLIQSNIFVLSLNYLDYTASHFPSTSWPYNNK